MQDPQGFCAKEEGIAPGSGVSNWGLTPRRDDDGTGDSGPKIRFPSEDQRTTLE